MGVSASATDDVTRWCFLWSEVDGDACSRSGPTNRDNAAHHALHTPHESVRCKWTGLTTVSLGRFPKFSCVFPGSTSFLSWVQLQPVVASRERQKLQALHERIAQGPCDST